MLYSEGLWNEWCQKIEDGYRGKTYDHFDNRFNFPEHKTQLQKILSNEKLLSRHSFLPLLKININTPRYKYLEEAQEFGLETKVRPISFASHFDTYIYAFLSFVLNKKYQDYIAAKGMGDCVLAYRSDLGGKCNIQFAKEVFEEIRRKGDCTAIALDIKGYFDSIDHKLLKEKWSKVLGLTELPPDQYNVFKSLSRYAYVNKNSLLKHYDIELSKLHPKPACLLEIVTGGDFNEKLSSLRKANLIVTNDAHQEIGGFKRHYGIPQGLAISALLSNIYLLDFDFVLHSKAQAEGLIYRRYCDDILIVGETSKSFDLQKFAIAEIEKYHLIIQDKKTEIIEFSKNSKGIMRAYNLKKIAAELPSNINKSNEQRFYKNLQYLGFEFNGSQILIRSSSLSRYFRKMKARIIKTISMAYSQNSKSDVVFKQQLFHRYTHLGKRNFLRYAYNASQAYYFNAKKERKEGMDSVDIRGQISRHFNILLHHLQQKNTQRGEYKMSKGLAKRLKVI